MNSPRLPPGFVVPAVLALLMGAIGGVLAARWEGNGDAPPTRPVRFEPLRIEPPSLRLRDQAGRWTTLDDARGDVLVLTFVYSTCRRLCPIQTATVADAVNTVGDGVQVYLVSVDPVGDTPERARGFLERSGLGDRRARFLVGAREELRPVWASFGIVPIAATPEEAAAAAEKVDALLAAGCPGCAESANDPIIRPAPDAANDPYPAPDDERYRGRARHPTGLDFEHSAYVLLIDKRGRQRVGFPFEHLDADLLARDIRILRDEA